MKDRRQAVRYALPGARVSWERDSFWRRFADGNPPKPARNQRLLDMSILGLGFTTKHPPEEKSKVRLKVFLPDTVEPVAGRGRVATVVTHASSDVFRVGVAFLEPQGVLAGKLRLTGTPLRPGADRQTGADTQ